jgi:FtsH-binding integral membrane protein
LSYTQMNPVKTAPGTEPRFFGRVMTWLAAGFGAALAGIVLIGPMIPQSLLMPLYFLALGVLLFSAFARKAAKALAGPLAIAIPAILGIISYPTLNNYVASGMGDIIVMAAAGTVVIFGSMAIWGWTTTKNLSGWYKPMFFILLGVIAVSLLNAFVFHIGTLELVISLGVLVIFSIYTVMDIQSLKNADKYGTDAHPAMYALNIFLNIWNIFMSLLRIFSAFR